MKSTHQVVLQCLSRGLWLAPHEIELELKLHGIYIAPQAVTARMRDVKKARYGSHCLVKRRRKGTEYFEYRIEWQEEKAA